MNKLEQLAIDTLETTGSLFQTCKAVRRDSGRYHLIAFWYGIRGGTSQRVYRDYLAEILGGIGDCIDTESAKWPQTRHSADAIRKREKYWWVRLDSDQGRLERFGLLSLRVNRQYSTGRIVDAYVNASRLWNYADCQNDPDLLWDMLVQLCPWFFRRSGSVNSAVFTYR